MFKYMSGRLYSFKNIISKILLLLVTILIFGCGSDNLKKEVESLKVINLDETTAPNNIIRLLKKDMSLLNGTLQLPFTLFYTDLKKTDSFYKFHNVHEIRRCCTNYMDMGSYIEGKKEGFHSEYYLEDWISLESYLNQNLNNIISFNNLQFFEMNDKFYYEQNYSFRPLVKATGSYIKGIKNGLFKYYNKSGNLTEEKNYKNGIEDGLRTVYYNNTDKVKYSVNYKDALLDGSYNYFYDNGQLKESGVYKDGEKTYSWKEYNKYGQIQSDIFYNFGKILLSKCYDDNGIEVSCDLVKNSNDSSKINKPYILPPAPMPLISDADQKLIDKLLELPDFISSTPRPENGYSPYNSLFGSGFYNNSTGNTLNVTAPEEADMVIFIRDVYSGETIRNEYIRANTTFSLTGLPYGKLKFFYLYGRTWDANTDFKNGAAKGNFMNDRGVGKSDDAVDYNFKVGYVSTGTLKLQLIQNGNLETVSASEDEI